MADNVVLNPGVGGDTTAADDIGGVKYQRVKVVIGADGTNDGDVATGNPMPVSDAGGSITVDGTVTANAGTNLNTSALALESGGNLAAAATSLAILDDWDSSDACKVVGPAAHDAAVSGNPVRVAAYASATAPTNVSADGDTVNVWADLAGRVQVGDGGATLSVDDGAGALTVDSAQLPAALAAGGGLKIEGVAGGVVVPISVATIPSHAVTNAGTFAVQVSSALPAGTNAIGSVKLTDGTDIADVLDLTNSNPVAVAIVDGSGDQITSFGGGTQYTEGDTDTTITGTAVMWEDGSDTLRVASAAKPLPVEIIAGAGSGGTAMTDDAAFTAGTTSITPVGGTYKSTRDAVDDNDGGAFAMTAKRGMYVSLETPLADSAMDDTNDCVKASIVVALPAGTAAIGKLAANSGVDIGDVDVTSVSGNVTVVQGTASNLNVTEASAAAIATSLAIIDDFDESDRCKVNPIVGQAGVAAGVGATGATVQRMVIANDAGRTLLSKGGTAASSGDNTLVSAGSNRLKVAAFSLSTTSTTAVTCIFQSGASGTELWRVVLQAATGTSTGANLAVPAPAWLFATALATLLNLNLSGAITVHYSLTYWDEA